MIKNNQADRRFATTLARGLNVLRCFKPTDNGLSNQEISKRTGMPKSSVSRLTFTLQSLGYLSHSNADSLYRLGPSLLALGNIANASLPFMQLASSIMQDLADSSQSLAAMGIRDGHQILLVKTWRPKDTSSIWLEAGYRLPILSSSSGQALLAAYSDAEFTKLLEHYEELTVTNIAPNEVRKQASAQLMAQGFVIAQAENRFTDKINAVSTVFRSPELSEPTVFICGGSPDILTEQRMQNEVGPKLRTAISNLANASGLPSAVSLSF